MRIEFDPDKDAGNRAKHGVSLMLAAELDWGLPWSGSMIGSTIPSCE